MGILNKILKPQYLLVLLVLAGGTLFTVLQATSDQCVSTSSGDLTNQSTFGEYNGISQSTQCGTDFNFDYVASEWDMDAVHVWRCQNPVNFLEYGHGGIKLLPRQLTLDMDVTHPDMTTSISNKFFAHIEISNITAFNTDPFNTWKSAFRECVKLSSKLIRGQVDEETEMRLMVWCNEGMDKPNGDYAIMGAKAGKKYGEANQGNKEALFKINDFEWLKEQYNVEN